MVIHYIILSSSYSTHSRIALHWPFLSGIDYSEVGPVVSRIEGCFGGPTVQMGVHIMQTQSEGWNSVVEEDPYFRGVRVVDSVDEFINLIKKDEFLAGRDVARYVLASSPCTPERADRLTYLCYADYLCRTGRQMFTGGIHASADGPTVDSILDGIDTAGLASKRMAVRSRLMFAANGAEIVRSIDSTLDRYGRIPADDLSAMTRCDLTPWSMAYSEQERSEIRDSLILKYHCNEEPGS